MGEKINVDKDIKLAETLPAKFYKDKNIFESSKKKIFLKCWHWIGDNSSCNEGNIKIPVDILPKFLNEPVIISNSDKNKIKCFSNVCTHRGNILVHEKCKSKKIICNYHGRRFDDEGKFEFMPEFKETINFPRKSDNLHDFPLFVWHNLIFVGLNPSFSIEKVFEKINERISFLPLQNLKLDKK